MKELYGEILMSAKAPKKDGKGYEYPAMGHLVGLKGRIRGDGKKLQAMAGYDIKKKQTIRHTVNRV